MTQVFRPRIDVCQPRYLSGLRALGSRHKSFESRHEVMGLVDGEAAFAQGELFRDRWLRATGETLQPGPPVRRPKWPGKIPPAFADIDVGISRTGAAWRKYPEVRENEALHVASIRAAKSCIYIENQYFTSPLVAAELAKRLKEPDGPEVIIVSTEHSPSYFDQLTMDHTRLTFIKTLKDADKHGRPTPTVRSRPWGSPSSSTPS